MEGMGRRFEMPLAFLKLLLIPLAIVGFLLVLLVLGCDRWRHRNGGDLLTLLAGALRVPRRKARED